jgi:hypothetical protein
MIEQRGRFTRIGRYGAPTLLAACALVLLATAVPGVFIIDDNAYIATIVGVRDGSLRLQSTEGLPPSPELLSFDASPLTRAVGTMPVAPNTPPLYSVFALPFSHFGVHGLIALQVLAFVICAWLVFLVVRRETARQDLAWLAMGVFVLCTYSIEYAQGIWPHCLTMMLVMTGVDIASRLRTRAGGARRVVVLAAIAGVSIGCAAGMRYQNIAVAAIFGIALPLLWLPRRAFPVVGYVLGCAIPLATSSVMNHSRLGIWNPISKGSQSYLTVGRELPASNALQDAVGSTWARVVDYSTWPEPTQGTVAAAIEPKSPSGQFRIHTGIKRAMLQSAPWLVVPLLSLALVWRRRRSVDAPTSLVRGFSLVIAGVIGMFAGFGYRPDGWCFNQRYFLELVPLLCVTFAIALLDWKPRWRPLGIGVALGILLAVLLVFMDDTFGGQIAMMKLPVFIAAVIGASWLFRERFAHGTVVFAVALGIGLGWAPTIHLADDITTSRHLRQRNALRLSVFERMIGDDDTPIALYAYWGAKDAYGPLLLERDIVIVDPSIDEARDAVTLLDALLQQGRIVYIDTAIPQKLLMELVRDRRVEGTQTRSLVRITPGPR